MTSRHMRPATLFLAILVSACGSPPEPDAPTAETGQSKAMSGAEQALAGNQSNDATPGPGRLPPVGDGARFVGRWAAEAALCPTLAWEFRPDRLRAPAGSECRFERTDAVPGGYDVRARCTAEGPPRPDVLKIRFAESAKAMLFESGSIADAGLVYCGPLESSPPAASAGGPDTR